LGFGPSINFEEDILKEAAPFSSIVEAMQAQAMDKEGRKKAVFIDTVEDNNLKNTRNLVLGKRSMQALLCIGAFGTGIGRCYAFAFKRLPAMK
jgi:hypothetical protein